ncbi:MAG: MMPL family transporter [Acidimicrobiales bacterium]
MFILSRIKGTHDAGKSTDEAIVEGLGRTGRLVTSAAIILFFAFAALAAAAQDVCHWHGIRRPSQRDRRSGAALAGAGLSAWEILVVLRVSPTWSHRIRRCDLPGRNLLWEEAKA